MELIASLFVVGMLLWWVIKRDLDERDRRLRLERENERQEALTREAKREQAKYEAEERQRSWELDQQMRGWKQEWLNHVRGKRLAFEQEERRETSALYRIEHFVNHCIEQLQQQKDSRGMVSAKSASDVLGWKDFIDDLDGRRHYNFYRMGAFSDRRDIQLGAVDSNPFPEALDGDQFRVDDITLWLETARAQDEQYRKGRLNSLREALPTAEQWEKGNSEETAQQGAAQSSP